MDIEVDHGEYFAVHDVCLIGTELVQVVAIDATANVITVERGFAGSTPAAHAIDIVVYRLGAARPEGSNPGWTQQTLTEQPYNYTQIWDATVSITGTEDALKNYAPDDLMAYRLDKRMAELYQMMERAYFYNSYRYAGSATSGRLSAGLSYFVYDTNDLATLTLTFKDIEDAMSDKFAAFGLVNVPDSLWCNAWQKRVISSWGEAPVRTERTENVVGNQITVIETDFGTVAVNIDHLILSTQVWLINSETCQMAPLQGRGFKEIEASVPGQDATVHRVLGEYVFVIKDQSGATPAADGLNVLLYNMDDGS